MKFLLVAVLLCGVAIAHTSAYSLKPPAGNYKRIRISYRTKFRPKTQRFTDQYSLE